MLIFAYGTLRAGQKNYYLLKDCVYFGDFRIHGWNMHSYGSFPAIVKGDGEITVECYRINEEVRRRLDKLEGYPNFYDRKMIDVDRVSGWIYYQHTVQCDAPLIPHGDWVNR